ncbi:MAG: hypothetical protein U0Z26_02335 [Anaerolineales bacterium]
MKTLNVKADELATSKNVMEKESAEEARLKAEERKNKKRQRKIKTEREAAKRAAREEEEHTLARRVKHDRCEA